MLNHLSHLDFPECSHFKNEKAEAPGKGDYSLKASELVSGMAGNKVSVPPLSGLKAITQVTFPSYSENICMPTHRPFISRTQVWAGCLQGLELYHRVPVVWNPALERLKSAAIMRPSLFTLSLKRDFPVFT